MGIKKIIIEEKNGKLKISFDGEHCVIYVQSEKIFQVSDSERTLTITTQVLPVQTPATIHNEYLISQDSLTLDIPSELRLSAPKVNQDE